MFSGGSILFPSLSMLTTLTIRDCEFLDDANLLPISQCCRFLRSLILFNASNMTESSFTPISQDLHYLRVLIIRGARHMTDSATAQLARAECASTLERIDLSDAYELSDETLYTFASVIVHETSPSTPIPASLTVVTPILPHVAKPVFRSLQHIALENCRRVTFRGVMAVARILTPYDPPVVRPEAVRSPVPNSNQSMGMNTTHPLPTTVSWGPQNPDLSGSDGRRPSSRHFHYNSRKQRDAMRLQGRSLVSLHVSGAWEGVTQKATVAYRDRAGAPATHREIHLMTHAMRGLVRDEFDVGAVGSGGAAMLWSIMPANGGHGNPAARTPINWFCRFPRSCLRTLLDEYSWIPVPIRIQSVVPVPVILGAPPLPALPAVPASEHVAS
jgi:hypothetical protein